MTKLKLSNLVVLALMLFAFYGCTTKNETPQPIVDQTAKASLQDQYNTLAAQVLGAQSQASIDSLAAVLSADQLKAAIAEFNANLNTKVNYSVQVLTFPGNPLPATVEISQGGKIVSATASAQGLANFSGLYAGRVIATVDYPGFTRLVFRADIRNPYSSTTYSTTTSVRMLPLGGTAKSDSAMTVQRVRLWANYSIVDDTLGGPQYNGYEYFGGVSHAAKALPVGPNADQPNVKWDAVTTQPIKLYINQNSFMNSYNGCGAIPAGFTGWNNPGSWNGEVISVAYENAIWTVTAPDADGAYTIKVPANDDNGNDGWMRFTYTTGEFQHNFTQYVNGSGPYVQDGSTSGPYAATPTWDQMQIFRIDNTGGSGTYSYMQNTASTVYDAYFNSYTN